MCSFASWWTGFRAEKRRNEPARRLPEKRRSESPIVIVEDQAAAIAFLRDPSSYGSSTSVEMMETHISRIFLVGGRAYKMKRAVKLPYADFSTPALRLATCRREVDLNTRTAPGLYLGVRRVIR